MVDRPQYDVALSFAGEDRAYVEMVAEHLKAKGVSVFYDLYEEADLWGKDLYVHLTDVYRTKAKYTVMFISHHYNAKLWTNHERRAAQSRAIEESGEYILPARFDDSEAPGVLPTTGYIDLRRRSPLDVALLVCKKLGRQPLEAKADQLPSQKSPSLSGEASFNYANHNGHFRIGSGHFEFDTRWSKADDRSIHCYTDSTNLHGIALVARGATLTSIPPVSNLDFTSHVRSPGIGQFLVLQNQHGVWAAVQILEIKDETRGDSADLLRFHYWILEDGSSSFASIQDEPFG